MAATITAALPYIVAGSAVGSLAYSIYKSENMPDMPSMPAPPKPASYYNEQYDENGDLIVSEQVWREDKNAYVTKYDPEPKYGASGGTKRPQKRGGSQGGWYDRDTGQRVDIDLSNQDSSFNPATYYDWRDPTQGETDAEYAVRIADWDKGQVESPEHQAWRERKESRKAAVQDYKKEKALRQEIRTKILGELDKTPEDRLKIYDEYATTLSNAMHTDVDKRFTETKRASEESMERRGMTGSRAGVDLEKELVNEKARADVDIAQRSVLAKSTLEQMDRDFNLRTIAELDAGRRTDDTLLYQKERDRVVGGLQATATANSGLMSAYGADIGQRMDRYKYDLYQNQATADRYMNTSLGLAYLYGKTSDSNKPANTDGAKAVGGQWNWLRNQNTYRSDTMG